MNKHERQMIKEAYQAGYQEALDESVGSALSRIGTRIAKGADDAGKFLKKLFRGSDEVTDTVGDIVPTNPVDDLVKAVQNTIPIGGDTKKLAQQIITTFKNDPNALKQGNIVVIKTLREPVAADFYGGTVRIVQQPENPNLIIGNIAIDVVDEGAEQIRRYGTQLGDASITLRGLDDDILILPDSQIDGIIFVDPKELDILYPGLDKRITDRTRDILRRMGGGSGSGGVGSG